MFTVSVRDRIMIAHSFKGAAFGPAQALHGATFVVDVKFCGTELHPENDFLIDVCEAETLVKASMKKYNYQNLDDAKLFPEFKGKNTTMEVVAREIWNQIGGGLTKTYGKSHKVHLLTVQVKESDVASAEYSCELDVDQAACSDDDGAAESKKAAAGAGAGSKKRKAKEEPAAAAAESGAEEPAAKRAKKEPKAKSKGKGKKGGSS